METRVEKLGDIQVLYPRGRLDLAAAAEFETLLNGIIDGGETRIVLDCRELSYVSSAGLGAFIAGGKKLPAGGKLVFANLSQSLQSLFKMAGITNLFDIAASQEDALRRLGAEPA